MSDFSGGSRPAGGGFSITPDDDNDLTRPTRGLFVGVAGDLKVDMRSGETVTLTNVAAGVIHPLAVKKVHATDTDATGIVGLD